jgi:hypothetical protein
MNDREKFDYASRVIAELVRRVEALMETPVAGRLIERADSAEDLDALLDQVSALLDDIEAPSGERGRLGVDPDSDKPYVVTHARVTGEHVVSSRPGDFSGVVWNEEMDRPPKDDG